MTYAQFASGQKLHLVCEPGEEYRGEVIRINQLSWPLCGLKSRPRYRMTINMPLGNACKRCQRALQGKVKK
jgi:hypothetical protein